MTTLLDGTDTGTQDTGTQDTGTQDTGTQDTGTQQTGTQDAGTQQTGDATWSTLVREDGSLDPRWLDRLPDDIRESARPTLEKIPNVEELARSYYHTKQMVGRKVEAPGEGATPDQVAEWRKIVGVPDSPDGYGIARPEGLSEDAPWSDDLAKEFAEIAHANNITPAAAKALIDWQGKHIIAGMSASDENDAKWLEDQRQILQKDWGDNMGKKMNAAKSLLKSHGIPETHAALVHADIIKMLSDLGMEKFGEDSSIGGTSSAGGGTAAEEVAAIQGDPNHPYWHKSHPLHEQAFQKVMNLNQAIAASKRS